MPGSEPQFFETPKAFRQWLRKNHAKASELVVGFHKKETGRPSITWPESVAEALCFGWIDGIRRTLDGDRYTIRFTPRRKHSKWSALNIRLVAELEAAGRMMPAGRSAFEAWRSKVGPKAKGYNAQKRVGKLDRARIERFKQYKGGAAWTFFEAQPPGYRKLAAWFVMSAKKDETRDKRLARLIEVSARGKRLV